MSNLENFGKTKNPITGTFGTGQVKYYYENDTFVVPNGISAVRVRLWGAGGSSNGANGRGAGAGGGGGFALKTISGLTSGASIAVTVGTSASASSSFGAYVSATGGASGGSAAYGGGGAGGAGGTGVGGDINNTGGNGSGGLYSSNTYYFWGGGGGCAGLTGKGGDGGGGDYNRADQNIYVGGAVGAHSNYTNTQWPNNITPFYSDANISDEFDISNLDLIGTGRGATGTQTTNYSFIASAGINGAGGIGETLPAVPGGGSHNNFAQGLVVVEY